MDIPQCGTMPKQHSQIIGLIENWLSLFKKCRITFEPAEPLAINLVHARAPIASSARQIAAQNTCMSK
jgi:hypothetical protein